VRQVLDGICIGGNIIGIAFKPDGEVVGGRDQSQTVRLQAAGQSGAAAGRACVHAVAASKATAIAPILMVIRANF
jgi:hypothetical protein